MNKFVSDKDMDLMPKQLVRVDGDVIFETKKEKPLALLLRKALKSGVHLYNVSLPGANLADAQLDGIDLYGADLNGACLEGASLRGAIFERAKLTKAKLSRAHLRGAIFKGARMHQCPLTSCLAEAADFRGADVSGSDMSDANFEAANFSDANACGTNFYSSRLTGATFTNADLTGACLSYTELSGATFSHTILTDAHLTRSRGVPKHMYGAVLSDSGDTLIARSRILPEGEIIGWKKCRDGVVVKLCIPAEARRSHAFGRKCRAEFADVMDVFRAEVGISLHNAEVTYTKGARVVADNFEPDWQIECAGGIHFFITRAEADAYHL